MVSGLDSSEKTLRELLQHNESIEIPLYQRHYRWKGDKIETLWNDIIASLEEPSGQRTLFLGPTVFHTEGGDDQQISRYLVDGQQRITTLSLITAYLFHKLGKVKLSSEDSQQAGVTRIELIEMAFSTGDDRAKLNEIEKYTPRLKLAKRDRQKYRRYLQDFDITGQRTYLKMAMEQIGELIDGEVEDRIRVELQIPHDAMIPDEEYENLFGQNLLELATQLSTLFDKTASFAVVEISDPFDPLTVFESLNSKGMPLAESDLIKNVLIQRVPDGQKEEVSDDWDSLTDAVSGSVVPFIRYWYISEYEFIRKKHLYASVKSQISDGSDVQRLLDQWKESAKWYAAFRNGEKPPEGDTELEARIGKFSELNFRLGIPILMTFASNGRIKQMKEALPILTTMYIRLFVTASIRGSIIEKKLDPICKEIRNSDKGLKKLEEEAKRLVQSHCPVINWKHLTASNTSRQKFILNEITRHQLNDPAKTLPSPAELQVEHVLPKNRSDGTYKDFDKIDHEHMVDHIGNLALLMKGDNSKVGNNEFEIKKEVYKEYREDAPPADLPDRNRPVDKNIPLTAELSEYDEWTKTAVQERGERLGKVANEIWSFS